MAAAGFYEAPVYRANPGRGLTAQTTLRRIHRNTIMGEKRLPSILCG